MAFPNHLVTGAVAAVLALGVTACGGHAPYAVAKTPASASSTPTPSALPTLPLLSPTAPNTGLPTDFPSAQVPLVAGAVSQPLGPGSGTSGKKGWVLELKLDQKVGACFAAAAKALLDHGFTKQPGETRFKGNHQALFTAPGYAVIISTSPSASGGCTLGYEVGQVSK